jgi:hypothetical protein
MLPNTKHVLSKLTLGKAAQKFGLLVYLVFAKLPKVNNHPSGESSTYQVTLPGVRI